MNKDQVEGSVKAAAGKVQEKVGAALGNKTQQVKGLGKQIAGEAQQALGKAKETIKDAKKAR